MVMLTIVGQDGYSDFMQQSAAAVRVVQLLLMYMIVRLLELSG